MITRTPLVEQVTQLLVQRIAQPGSPGQMLPAERELSREMGVSRPVLREAIRNLEMQGLVEVRHGVGVRVINKPHRPLVGAFDRLAGSSRERLAQFAVARLVIEPGVARLAASSASAGQVRGLRKNLVAHAAERGLAQAAELDLDFHRQIALIAGNPILLTILDALADVARETRVVSMQAFGVEFAVKGAILQHTPIADAIASHDADAAEQAMRSHLLEAQRDVERASRHLQRRPRGSRIAPPPRS